MYSLTVNDQDTSDHNYNADISILALNATGEMRYMGPSSGCLFARYAIHFAKGLVRRAVEQEAAEDRGPSQTGFQLREPELAALLSPPVRKFLLRSYLCWIQPIYALFDEKQLYNLINQYTNGPERLGGQNHQYEASRVIFYLVIGLGAVLVEQAHVAEKSLDDLDYPAYQSAVSKGIGSECLFSAAIMILDRCHQLLNSRFFMIQILTLVSIYSAYKPSGNSVWQISGLTMRVSNTLARKTLVLYLLILSDRNRDWAPSRM